MTETICCYVDASCPENPGQGGYAAVLVRLNEKGEQTKKWTVDGIEEKSSNMRAKLLGAIEALRAIPSDFAGNVVVLSDTRYLIDGGSKWIHEWMEKGIEHRENSELWVTLYKLIKDRSVVFQHQSPKGNKIATEAKLRSRLALAA